MYIQCLVQSFSKVSHLESTWFCKEKICENKYAAVSQNNTWSSLSRPLIRDYCFPHWRLKSYWQKTTLWVISKIHWHWSWRMFALNFYRLLEWSTTISACGQYQFEYTRYNKRGTTGVTLRPYTLLYIFQWSSRCPDVFWALYLRWWS